jgi:membrane protease YdiL (CAAX protease family)
MNRSNRSFLNTAAVAVALAVVPLPGRWAILQQALPVLLVALYYWRNDYSLQRSGLGRPPQGWPRCIGLGIVLAVALYVFEAVTVDPLTRLVSDDPKDLSLFEPIQGDLAMLAIFLAFMWVFAAFGEEFLWRGFLLREIAERTERWRFASARGVLVTAVLFGSAHAYQGLSGVVEKTLSGILIGAVYVRSGRSSIWLVVIIHGIQNTISFVAIYFDVYGLLHAFSW